MNKRKGGALKKTIKINQNINTPMIGYIKYSYVKYSN